MVQWRRATWDADVPSGASLTISVRTGSTSTPDATWTPWAIVASNDASLANLVRDSRYLQYRVDMTGSVSARPVLRSIGFHQQRKGAEVRERDRGAPLAAGRPCPPPVGGSGMPDGGSGR